MQDDVNLSTPGTSAVGKFAPRHASHDLLDERNANTTKPRVVKASLSFTIVVSFTLNVAQQLYLMLLYSMS